MKSILTKPFVAWLLISASLLLQGCLSECPNDCPSACVPITFTLTQDGINILNLDPMPFSVESIQVASTPANPEAPPSFRVDNTSFRMVVCRDTEYELQLDGSTTIRIVAEIETLGVDNCCEFFKANSIQFNGEELCSDPDQCDGGAFELL